MKGNLSITSDQPSKNFTKIPNDLLRSDLSPNAFRIILFLLSMSEWEVNQKGLSTVLSMSQRAVTSGVKELKDKGFISIRKEQSGKVRYFLSNTASTISKHPDIHIEDKANKIVPCSSLRRSPDRRSPERRDINKTKKKIRLKVKEPPLPPTGGRGSKSEDFDLFWKAYPRKVKKQKARDVFFRKYSKMPSIEKLVGIINTLSESDEWQKDSGKFIPHPTSWLNAERWEDELEIMPAGEHCPECGSLMRHGTCLVCSPAVNFTISTSGPDRHGVPENDMKIINYENGFSTFAEEGLPSVREN